MRVQFECKGAVVGEDVQFTPNGKSVGKVTKVICEAEITDEEAKKLIKGPQSFDAPMLGISGYGVPVSGYGIPVSGLLR
jgi:hypothetical protein